MIYKLDKVQEVEVADARSNLDMLVKHWTNKAINDLAQAIREVRALDSSAYQEMRNELIRAIAPVLPGSDSHATSIVDGVLNMDSSPYQQYLKEHFRTELQRVAQAMLTKKVDDIYKPAMADFLKQERKDGQLGSYFFGLNKLALDAEQHTAASFVLQAKSELLAKVIGQDKKVMDVEDDAVGLSAHLADINPKYHAFLKNLVLSNNLNKAYAQVVKEEFLPQHQAKAIDRMTAVVSSFAGRGRKAA